MSKDQQQAVYRLRQEQYGNISPSAGTGTTKDYSDLKRQVSALPKNVNDLITIDEPSSDEDVDKKKKFKCGGNKSNPALG